MKDIFSKVLRDIKPDSKENEMINSVCDKIIRILNKNAEELGIKIQAVLGGSASRGTNMKGNHDLDFFIRFQSEGDIKSHYKLLMAKSFDGFKIVHGTRDYFRGFFKGFKVEFVPSIKFDSPKKAINSADISFFHIDYLKKKLEKNPKLRDEILLLKQFLKANDSYGAESARGGFSGYICELLIIHFESFYNLMEYFENAKPKIIIDIEKHYKSSEDALKSLGKSKTMGPLVIVDPLLKNRNASSCVSMDGFCRFLFKLRLFLRSHDPKLFNIRGIDSNLVAERSKRRGTKLILFKIKGDGDFDILKAKALKRMGQIENELKRDGYLLYSFGVTDDSYAFFELETIKVSDAKKHFGPFVWCDANHFSDFMEKWKNKGLSKPYAFDSRLAADALRVSDAKDFIKERIKEFL